MIIIPTFQKTTADFKQTINLENQLVQIRLTFNIRNQSFFMDFTDFDNNSIYGIKIVPNWPLLKRHKTFIDFSGDIMVLKSDNIVGNLITFDNLSNGWALTYLTADELAIWEANNGL